MSLLFVYVIPGKVDSAVGTHDCVSERGVAKKSLPSRDFTIGVRIKFLTTN